MDEPVGFDDQPAAQALLGSLLTGIDEVIHGKLFCISGDELVQFGQQVETLARKVFAAQVRIADEIDGQSLAAQRGYSSTSAMLREVLRISPADASSRVKAAKATLPQDLPSGGEAPPMRPLLGAAIDAGVVGAEHARTTLAAFRHLPKGLSQQVLAQAEEVLVGHAGAVGPAEFDRIARHLEVVFNPDGNLAEDDCQARAEFSIGSRNPGTGLTPISGKLDDRSVEQLRQAIDALSKPTPSADGVADSRPAANRRAMGLAMLAAWFLRSGDGPATGGEPPRVVITIDWDLMQQQLGDSAVTDSGLPMSAAQVRRVRCASCELVATRSGPDLLSERVPTVPVSSQPDSPRRLDGHHGGRSTHVLAATLDRPAAKTQTQQPTSPRPAQRMNAMPGGYATLPTAFAAILTAFQKSMTLEGVLGSRPVD